MKYEHGKYIHLAWDCSPEVYYIKGHVTHKEGMEELKNAGAIESELPRAIARHVFARWSCEGGSEYDHTLIEYDEPGRGRFKVTAFNAD